MTPAASTPGIARMRSSARSANVRTLASSRIPRRRRARRRPIRTCSALKPGIDAPAAAGSSQTAGRRRSAARTPAPPARRPAPAADQPVLRPAVPVRPSSRRTLFRFDAGELHQRHRADDDAEQEARPSGEGHDRSRPSGSRDRAAARPGPATTARSAPAPSAEADEHPPTTVSSSRLRDELTRHAAASRAERVPRRELLQCARSRARARDW